MLTNRLKPILGNAITNNQNAFVPSRLTIENVMVGYECLHREDNPRL